MTPPSATPLLAAAALLLLPTLSLRAVELAGAATDPVGFSTLSVPGAATAGTTRLSLRSLGLLRPVEYLGRAEQVTTNSITDDQATWAQDAYNPVAGRPRYFVEIVRAAGSTTAAPGEGTTYDISATGAASHTLTLAQPLSAEVVAAGAAVCFKVRAHWTLATALGSANELGLQAGTEATADLVQLFDAATQKFTSYYFGTGSTAYWREAVTGNDASNVVIYPEDGLVLRRKSVGAKEVVLMGGAKMGATVVPIVTGTNLIAQIYAANMTLESSGLLASGFQMNEGAGGDEVAVHDGTKYISYYYQSGGVGTPGWINANTKVKENPTLAPGSAMIIKRRAAQGFNWQIPAQPSVN